MKKILILLFISHAIFSQKLTKEKLIEEISNSTCACISDKKITPESLESTIGICMLQDFTKYQKDIEKFYGKNVLSDESKMDALGTDVGLHMTANCPSFLKIVLENINEADGLEESKKEEEELYVLGTFTNLKAEQFITFSIKENSGKYNDFILLNNFDNSFLITDNVIKPNDSLKVYYYELEMYDAKIKKFVTYKIVSDIIKN